MEMQLGGGLDGQPQAPAQQEPAIYEFTLDSILARIEKAGALDSVSRSLMTLKLQEMCKNQQPQEQTSSKALQDQKFKLWSYCENKLATICSDYDTGANVIPAVEVLCLIVNKYTMENYQRKLLVEVFF